MYRGTDQHVLLLELYLAPAVARIAHADRVYTGLLSLVATSLRFVTCPFIFPVLGTATEDVAMIRLAQKLRSNLSPNCARSIECLITLYIWTASGHRHVVSKLTSLCS